MSVVALKYGKYSDYKESGEYWMGDVPKHWYIRKLKHLFYEKKITHNPALNCGSISFGKVVYKDDEKIPLSTKASYQEVLKGEFLINPLNLNYDLISLRIALSDKNVVVSSGYIVLKNNTRIDKNYYKWLLHRYDVAYMKLLGSGVRQTINFNHIANSILAFPPIEEQTAIANFLDEKTTKIDQAIAQKEKLIELLKERKQIIIQNAVTKGLDATVKLKNSGVDWIGEIPEHWETADIRRFTKEHRQGYYDESGYDDSGHKVVRITDMLDNNIIDISDSPYYKLNEENRLRYELKKGDFLFQRTGSHKKIGVFNSEEPSIYASFLIRFRFDDRINHKFLLCFFNSDAYTKQLNSQIHGGVNPNIHAENIKICKVVIPTIKEQSEIVSYIKGQSDKIDKAITLQQTQIEKLKEYKATLIDSTVTGKIKVC